MKRFAFVVLLAWPLTAGAQPIAPSVYPLNDIAGDEMSAAYAAGEVVACKIRPNTWGQRIVDYLTTSAEAKVRRELDPDTEVVYPDPEDGIDGQFTQGNSDMSFGADCTDVIDAATLSGLDSLIGWKN